jgi:hypothetical protein
LLQHIAGNGRFDGGDIHGEIVVNSGF